MSDNFKMCENCDGAGYITKNRLDEYECNYCEGKGEVKYE